MTKRHTVFAAAAVLSALTSACGGAQPSETATAPTASAAPEETSAPVATEDEIEGPENHPLEVKGKLGDAEYKPVMAVANAAFQKNGNVYLVLELFESEHKCGGKPKVEKGDRQVMVSVPWATGQKIDLAMPPPDESFNPNRMKRWDGSRWDTVDEWKAPFGSIEVFEAPTKSGEKGRVRMKVRVGRMKLRGDLPVLLCVDAH
jgi:hypothetical protein